ncbi:MAG: hypothetical protein IPN20_15250 [Haliscomenobacter sp.]|nr:hypothetical protein [Haliscomenobacter sp.]
MKKKQVTAKFIWRKLKREACNRQIYLAAETSPNKFGGYGAGGLKLRQINLAVTGQVD